MSNLSIPAVGCRSLALAESPRAKSQHSRPAFTLLEMLLATFVSVLLMAALYVAMEVQLKHAQSGRDRIEQATLARALLNRIAADIVHSVTPAAPTPWVPPPPPSSN